MRLLSPARSLLIAFFAPIVALAQTNTFPSSGNVGIGTTSPGTNLLRLVNGTSGGNAYNVGGLVVESNGRSSIQLLSPNSSDAYLFFGDASAANKGYVGQTGSSATPANLMVYYSAGNHALVGGNVGIGTTSPTAGLEVTPGPARWGMIINGGDAGSLRFGQGAQGFLSWDTNKAIMGALSGNSLELTANGATAMTLANSGNVGVGTTSPTAKLTVGDGTGNQRITIDGGTAGQVDLAWRKASVVKWLTYMGANSSDLTFNDGSDRVTFQSGGNVGIGTTNPTQKLSVNGTIQAKEVVVQTGWSDYVFDESYKLKALSEVEAYVKAEKHLPGIPSAKEVAEDGVSMGEMQSKLLAKIEELTLHVIAQEKRLHKVEAENAALRAGYHD